MVWRSASTVVALGFALAFSVAGSASLLGALHAAWADRGLHVVGGPVAAGGRVVVLVSASDRSVSLEAIDPASGVVAWKLPESFSLITAGVETVPVAHAGVVLALVPSGGAGSALVQLEGVRAADGGVVWKAPRPMVVTDAPTACPQPLGKAAFCVVAATAASAPPSLLALSPTSGATLATVPGIERQLSTTPGLYELVSIPSVLAGVRTPGDLRWTQRVSRLFGPGYDPNYGWDFDRFGAVFVGSVAKASSPRRIPLGTFKTDGVSAASGRRLWSDPGFFQCSGSDIVPGPYLCLMTGTAAETASGSLKLSKGAGVTLEGFDPGTGRVTWSRRVGGLADLIRGRVAVSGRRGLVVESRGGGRLLLDLLSGSAAPAGAHSVFWCAHENFFTINPPAGVTPHRVGSSLFSPCDAGQRPASAGAHPSPLAGVTVGSTFVWASPEGLAGMGA